MLHIFRNRPQGMPTVSNDFDYDIAFSLLSRDVQLALRLADLLAPLRCFVFTTRQRDVVGRDGVEAFAELFRRKARLAVILFELGMVRLISLIWRPEVFKTAQWIRTGNPPS